MQRPLDILSFHHIFFSYSTDEFDLSCADEPFARSAWHGGVPVQIALQLIFVDAVRCDNLALPTTLPEVYACEVCGRGRALTTFFD